MASNYSLRKKAAQDLDEILSYVAKDNPKAALELYKTFLKQFEYLSVFPEVGRLRKEFTPVVRSLPSELPSATLGLSHRRYIS